MKRSYDQWKYKSYKYFHFELDVNLKIINIRSIAKWNINEKKNILKNTT